MGPDILLDHQGTCKRLPDILRICQDRLATCRRLLDGARQSPRPSAHLQETPTVYDDRRGACRRLTDGARKCPRPSENLKAALR
ncbi:hypothetical protein DPMN_109301 [Dreissena polymorpha]|uniref:Uncharacterized protein n=1 Tax=Dreissena polymorpha TaxID=45954 RepID=A0A9D4KAR9_DREPO|nr:hypothetical protein DPMN_109301 [Dreissena polymorpha]